MKDNSMRNFIIVLVLIGAFTGLYFIIRYVSNNNSLEYEEYLKDYKVNEYIATYVSEEDMAKIYLNDYIHNMYYNIEKAYNSLDTEYRNKKFGSLENYSNYIYSLDYTTYNLSKYYKYSKDGYVIFGVYDTNGNLYLFKTNGVMQYTVYLDDYTVEI